MKTISNFIIEKLIINKNTKIQHRYNYHPENDEIKALIVQLIKERGEDADLNDIDTSQIKNMSYLFYCVKSNVDISKWDVSNVENMSSMFSNSDFDGDLSDWDVSKVENMSGMFYSSQFTGKNGDISNWDVSNVKNMANMFYSSQFTGKNGDISKWDVSKVENMSNMFKDSEFNGNIDNWKVNDKAMSTITFKTFNGSPLEKNPPKWYAYKNYKDPGHSFFDKVNEKEVEKLLNKNKLGLSIDDIDENKKYNKQGKAFLFWKCWVVTAVYGPLTKENVLKKNNEIEKCPPGGPYYVETTSYGTAFAKWNKEGRFTSKGVKVGIIPNKQKDWKKYK